LAKKIHLRVVTPDAVKAELSADMVIMRCNTGDMGVLPGHEACSAVLDYGVLRIMNEGSEERRMAVFGGVAQIRDDVVSILANSAEWPEDIDHAKVEAARDAAQRRLQEETDDMDIARDQVLLRRSLVQLEVSTYSTLNKPSS